MNPVGVALDEDIHCGYRYGVFLRPSPAWSQDALRAYDIVVNQFGLHAAAAYPPHVTLVGSIAIDGRERDLVAAVATAVDGRAPVRLHSDGIALINNYIGYRLSDLDQGPARSSELMGAILEAVRPVRVYPPLDRTNAERKADSPANFRPHLTVVGHDGAYREWLLPEILEHLLAVGIGAPCDYECDRVELLRLRSENWSGRYWETMSWTIIGSWQLGSSSGAMLAERP